MMLINPVKENLDSEERISHLVDVRLSRGCSPIEPTHEAGLLYLHVQGFMAAETLEAISQHGYTQFDATVAKSDLEPGIYPKPAEYRWENVRFVHDCVQTQENA